MLFLFIFHSYFDLFSGYLGSTLEGQVLAELWNLLFKEEIRELNYEADEAGSSVYTSIDKTGVMLTFSGFSDKIAELVENIFAKLIEFRTSLQEHTFNNIYQSYSMDLKNATKDVPFWQVNLSNECNPLMGES